MGYQLWLADVLRAAGLPVREIEGWRTRGHGAMGSVLGVLCHHTAGPVTGLYPSEQVVVQGRTDLAGPLANLGLDRGGTWIVIAAGQAWHAGTGTAPWCPAGQGNTHLLGVEAESVGTRDDWTPAQRTSYPRGAAALLRHLALPAARAIGHKEWAAGRKIDPAFWDMTRFRADVASWMTTPEEDDLPTIDELARLLDQRLAPIARREDIGFARGQILTALGVADPLMAPAGGAAVGTGPAAGPVQLSAADVQRIATAVLDELARRSAT